MCIRICFSWSTELGCSTWTSAGMAQSVNAFSTFHTRFMTMVWQKLLSHFRATVPHLRPIRELMIAFAITGYLIYRLPISGENWDNG